MAAGAERVIPEIKLIDDDGEPLESPWHLASIIILLDCVTYCLQPRTDYFVGGNMFLYYGLTQARKRDLRGPDFSSSIMSMALVPDAGGRSGRKTAVIQT
jgi:hypothetical protein